MDQNTVLIVCVHYHNTDEVREFLCAVDKQRGDISVHVRVIDNSGELLPLAQEVDREESAFTVQVLDAGGNVGYYRAAAFGLEHYLTNAVQPQWVIVCNTDIGFVGDDFFARLIAMHDSAAAIVISPKVVTELGEERFEFTRERPTRKWLESYLWILEHRKVSLLYHAITTLKIKARDVWRGVKARLGWQAPSSGKEHFSVYAPAGSFTCFSHGYFDAGGDLHHGAFLYGEEVFVAESTRRINGTVFHDPRLGVVHQGFSTTNVFRSPQIVDFKRDAVRYYRDEFFTD